MEPTRIGAVATDRRALLAALATGLFAAGSARADTACGDPAQAARDRALREDFANIAKYAEDNARVRASGDRPCMIFLGDSITERWMRLRPGFFGNGRVCRGIGGQTTPQMLVRMVPDVIGLRPHAVHILAGTNDIAANTGPMTLEQSRDNIDAMATLARAHGIRVLIGSVPPAAAFRWRPEKRPARDIMALNDMLRRLAERHRADWIDYHSALTDAEGGMRENMAGDGVHPLPAGYAVMEEVLAPHLPRIACGKRHP